MDGGGLRLVLKQSGSKAWVYRYRFNGIEREASLGIYPTVTVEQARRLRDRMEATKAEGFDPVLVRQQERQQQAEAIQTAKLESTRQAVTLAIACRSYHETKIEPTAKNPKHAAQWIQTLETHVFPDLGKRAVTGITKGEILDVVQAVLNKTPETGRRVLQRLSVVFDELVFKEVLSTNPVAAVRNQVKMPARVEFERHFKSLPWTEVQAFYKALVASADSMSTLCLKWVLLTACRTGEALGLESCELDLDRAIWTIPGDRMKAKRAHTVYLSTHAVELAKQLIGQGTGPVFSNPHRADKPMSNAAMLQTLGRLKYRDRTTVHGLRSTFSTWANEHNFRPDVIEVSLAHQESDRVRKAYNHAAYLNERRVLMQSWGDYLTNSEAVDVVPPNTVNLRVV